MAIFLLSGIFRVFRKDPLCNLELGRQLLSWISMSYSDLNGIETSRSPI
jgi:hypothetical protein